MIEELTHALEVLAGTPVGSLALIAGILLILTPLVIGGLLVYALIRQAQASNRQAETWLTMTGSQSNLIQQLTRGQLQQVDALDKLGDAMQATNALTNQVRASLAVLAESTTELAQDVATHFGVLADAVRDVKTDTALTLETLGPLSEQAGGAAEAVQGLNGRLDRIDVKLQTVTGAVQGLCERWGDQQNASDGLRDSVEVLTELTTQLGNDVQGVRDDIRLLADRLRPEAAPQQTEAES